MPDKAGLHDEYFVRILEKEKCLYILWVYLCAQCMLRVRHTVHNCTYFICRWKGFSNWRQWCTVYLDLLGDGLMLWIRSIDDCIKYQIMQRKITRIARGILCIGITFLGCNWCFHLMPLVCRNGNGMCWFIWRYYYRYLTELDDNIYMLF